MFIGREKEIRDLNKLYNSDKFEFAVIYGRRRVGKTAIINEFIKEKNTALFGECKWMNEKVDAGVLENLIEKSRLFHHQKKHYYLFAKTGFTKGCMEKANEMGNVTLVSYDTILQDV